MRPHPAQRQKEIRDVFPRGKKTLMGCCKKRFQLICRECYLVRLQPSKRPSGVGVISQLLIAKWHISLGCYGCFFPSTTSLAFWAQGQLQITSFEHTHDPHGFRSGRTAQLILLQVFIGKPGRWRHRAHTANSKGSGLAEACRNICGGAAMGLPWRLLLNIILFPITSARTRLHTSFFLGVFASV